LLGIAVGLQRDKPRRVQLRATRNWVAAREEEERIGFTGKCVDKIDPMKNECLSASRFPSAAISWW
jgi:hypothetical protein